MALLSMTGFGRCELEAEGRRMVVEIKSVNNRYLDVNIRLPKVMSLLEETVRGRIKSRVARGRVDVFIHYENLREDAKSAQVDVALLKGYLAALAVMEKESGLANNVTLADLMRLPELVTLSAASEDMDALTALMNRTLDEALDQLVDMRQAEGEKLRADIEEKLSAIERMRDTVADRAPMVVEEYRARLAARLEELLAEVALDEGRLANEVALFSDRCSIAEELTRLSSHIGQTRIMLADGGPVGRKLDFMMQEFNREVNTICSKANDLAITNAGLSMKNEIEKMREQVQNIE